MARQGLVCSGAFGVSAVMSSAGVEAPAWVLTLNTSKSVAMFFKVRVPAALTIDASCESTCSLTVLDTRDLAGATLAFQAGCNIYTIAIHTVLFDDDIAAVNAHPPI